MHSRERGAECINALRRLFLLLAATRQRRRLTQELIDELKNVTSEPQQGPKRLRLLCSAILREITPTNHLLITNLEPPVEQKNIPVILPLVWVQGQEHGLWTNHVPQLVQWLTNPGVPVELQTLSLGSLQLLIHVDDNLISQGFFLHITQFFYCIAFTPLLVCVDIKCRLIFVF